VDLSVDGSTKSNEKFHYKISTINVNGLKLASLSMSPFRFEVEKSEGIVLIIPFVGRGNIEAAGSAYEWQGSELALLLPGCAYSGTCTLSSVLMININPVRLGIAAAQMQSSNVDAALTNDMSEIRKINLNAHRLSFDKIFQQLCAVIEQMTDYPELLGKSGIDESFYRVLALALQPEILGKVPDTAKIRKYARRKLDRTCHYIKAHIVQQFSLSNLDHISGMSRRSLHYEFQERYRCTPMQWVRAERLHQAHNKLSRAIPSTTVTSVALACGFSTPESFSNHYKKKYGESPANVLKRVLNR
jgi:AraC-like DNA-binding protein